MDDVDGYADAAPLYWKAGWRGVLPIPRGKKLYPPTGYTGHGGLTPSYADIQTWIDTRGGDNICLRLPENVVGIDVDAYGEKTGQETLKEAEKRWSELPPAVQSTSRDDGISSIRLFSVPPGTYLQGQIRFPELGIGDIEIIQNWHRYVMVWPSIHPDGRVYRWNPGSIPSPDDLPALPTPWITGLKSSPTKLLDFGTADVNACLTGGVADPRVTARLVDALRDLSGSTGSRHDITMRHVLALLRLGKDGCGGVGPALLVLREQFVSVVTADGSRSYDMAVGEFKRFVTNPRIASVLATPSFTDWMRFIPRSSDNGDAPTDPVAGFETGFWDSRPSLRTIFDSALAGMCSPWAVLAYCAARALATTRPKTVLPALIGGPGSLNWFAAIAAGSGGGKGAASAIARKLVPTENVPEHGLGSGEGMIGAYRKPATEDEPPGFYESVIFSADEVDTLTSLGSRTGSTTMSVLRSGFSGEPLGFSYMSSKNRLPAHGYRMTVVMAVQPQRAAALFADGYGGTPQRFMWFPGTDRRITVGAARPFWESALVLPNARDLAMPRTVEIPEIAKDLIITMRARNMQGDVEALDGHALFCREKFAYALAILDGRVEMTLEDWQLSEIAANMSMLTRDMVQSAIAESDVVEAAERGRLAGVTNEAAEFEKTQRRNDRMQRVLDWVLGKLAEAGADGLSRRQLTLKIASRDRSMLDGVLAAAAAENLIACHPQTGNWVKL